MQSEKVTPVNQSSGLYEEQRISHKTLGWQLKIVTNQAEGTIFLKKLLEDAHSNAFWLSGEINHKYYL